MKFFKKQLPLIMGILFMAGSVSAQVQQQQQIEPIEPDSVSDEEIEQLVDVMMELQVIRQETQDTLEAIVNEEDMELERFEEIMMSQRNPQMAQQIEVTQEEQEKIQTLQPQLVQLSQQVRQKQVQVIQDKGMELQRYQRLMQSIQTQPELTERFKQALPDTADTGGMN